MRNKLALAAALLLAAPASFAEMDLITEAVYDVLEDQITGDLGKLTDKEFLQELIESVAQGTSDKIVQDIVDGYDPASVASEAGMKILEKLVPAAAGPIELIMMASDIAHEGTRNWLDWAKANRMEEFNTLVIEKGGDTVAGLDAAWNNFNADFIQTGLSDTGVLYAERPDLLREMKTAYAMRRKELLREEQKKNAVKARVEAKQRAYKRLAWMRKEARMKAEGVVSMLKITGQPVTRENVRKTLKDQKEYNALVGKWLKEVEKAAEAKEGAKPPVSGDPELDRAAAVVMVSKQPVAEGSAPDYGKITAEYAANAERLLANSETASEYWQVRSALYTSAANMHSACVDPILAKMAYSSSDIRQHYQKLYDACGKANQACMAEFEKTDKRLKDQADALRAELEGLSLGGPGTYAKPNAPLAEFIAGLSREFYGSDAGKKLEKADGVAYDLGINNAGDSHAHWAAYDWAGKTEPPLQKIGEFRAGFAGLALVYEQLAPVSASLSARLLARIQEAEAAYAQAAGKYSDVWQRNSALAEYSGQQEYKFEAQTRDIAAARAELANPKSFASSAFLAELQDRARGMRREEAAWDKTYKLNEKFAADFKSAPAEMEALANWPGPKPPPMQLSWENLQKYYDAEFKDFVSVFLQGALILLDEKTRAQRDTGRPPEAKPFGNGYKEVMAIAETPSYATLAEHNKKLAEFRRKLDELKAVDPEGRTAKADALAARIAEAAGKIPVPAKETAELQAAFAKSRAKLFLGNAGCAAYAAFGGDACLNYAVLDGLYKEYEAKVRKAEEYEQNALAACKKSLADLSYDYRDHTSAFFGGSKWKPSEQILQTCGAADRAKYAAQEKEFQKYRPFKEASVAGKPLDWGDIQLSRSDLKGGKAVVSGSLNADAPAYPQVYVSLNGDYGSRAPGQTVPVSGGRFEYSFTPVPGETYYVGVQAVDGPGGMKSLTLPSRGYAKVALAAEDRTAEAQAFYEKFRAAYEARNAAQVMALISPDWGAGGDDTTLEDLEENLRTNFRLYDEIRFSFSGLRVTQQGAALQACYDTVITSRIFKRNLKHEEKASVCDELREEGGKLRIARTLSGRYWYVK